LSFGVGILPLVAFISLLPVALRRGSRSRLGVWYVLAITGVILALGINTPFGHVLWHVPLFGAQRLQNRNIAITDFALSVLVAFWADRLATDHESAGIVYTFAIGGDAKYPEVARYKLGPLVQGVKYDPKDAPAGAALYFSNCLFCHGVPGVDKGGNIPNLAYVDAETIENLQNAVIEKHFADRGMPDFDGKLKPEDLEKIKAFIQGTADAIRPK